MLSTAFIGPNPGLGVPSSFNLISSLVLGRISQIFQNGLDCNFMRSSRLARLLTHASVQSLSCFHILAIRPLCPSCSQKTEGLSNLGIQLRIVQSQSLLPLGTAINRVLSRCFQILMVDWALRMFPHQLAIAASFQYDLGLMTTITIFFKTCITQM